MNNNHNIHPADQSLVTTASSLTTGRRARQLAQRWNDNPHLAGWQPADIMAALAEHEHPNHNQLKRGLVQLTQQHDPDASVLLLAALRPALWRLAHNFYGNDPQGAFSELLTNAMLAITRIDPTQDRLYGRILGRARSATRRKAAHRYEELVAELDELAPLSDDRIIQRLTARAALTRLVEMRRTGELPEQGWADLVAVRLHGTATTDVARGRSDHHVRADISRFSQRIEQRVA